MASIAYGPNWQSQALAQGKDVNSPEFASYHTMDQGGGNNGNTSGNSANYIQSATDQIRKNMQPGIDQLNTGIANTGTAYNQYRTTQQGNIAPLQQRYQAVLDSIKGNQTAAENKQTAVTSAELGRRGITTDSGVGATEVNNALQPITAQYSQQGANVGLQEQQDINGINTGIANSYIGENTDTNGIRGALASLYGNAATSGASTGASLYGTDTQAEIQRNQLAQQKAQEAIQNALAQQQLQEQIRNDTMGNQIQQGQLGISGGNLGVSQGNLALNKDQFAFTKQQQDPAYIAKLMKTLGINTGSTASSNQSRAPLSSFNY